ncbi:hypothetical protein BJ944DRAFT_287466 [Cunninghamella echinulata]|nr:hypothetical protein BJ944DRAFT_287466 [Cunninghamella echinulata]
MLEWALLFSILFIIICLFFIYQLYISNQQTIHTPLSIHPYASTVLQKVNLVTSQLSFIPTFFRVYFLGVIETVIILFWKRGIFGGKTNVDTEMAIDQLIQQYQLDSTKQQRYAIITGADSGIGFEIAKSLLMIGYHVIIASRTTSLGKQAQQKLVQLTGSSKVTFYTMDLCSFESVHQFIQQVQTLFKKGEIDVLINNAGVMNIPYTVTKDGLEAQCQTNYISPLLLTLSLLPWINQQHGHILFAASSTLYAATPLDPFIAKTRYRLDGLTHYAHSKMMVTQLTRILGQKLQNQASRIKVNCYHPGTVRTNLFAHSTIFTLSITKSIFDYIMLTPKEGSGTPLYLVMKYMDDHIIPDSNGQYWADALPQQIPTHLEIKLNTYKKDKFSTDIKTMLWTTTLALCDLSPLEVDNWIKSTVLLE